MNDRIIHTESDITPASHQTAHMLLSMLADEQLSGINQTLRRCAEIMDAKGCILWEYPSVQENFLEPMAHGFKTEGHPSHQIEKTTFSGSMLEEGSPEIGLNNKLSNQGENAHRFLDDFKLNKATACILNLFPPENESLFTDPPPKHVLTFYRSENQEPFDDSHLDELKYLKSLLPGLLRSMTDREALGLLLRCESRFNKLKVDAPPSEMEHTLSEIASEVADTFRCHEVSIFLNDELDALNMFKLQGRYWSGKWKVPDTQNYLGQHQIEGITGWMLDEETNKERICVQLHNLWFFKQYPKKLSELYKGMKWIDSFACGKIPREVLKKHLEVPDKRPLPPFALMASPMYVGNNLVGGIRCSIGKNNWCFSQHQAEALWLVANSVAHRWQRWMLRRLSKEKDQLAKSSTEFLRGLHSLIQKQIREKNYRFGPVIEHLMVAFPKQQKQVPVERVWYCKKSEEDDQDRKRISFVEVIPLDPNDPDVFKLSQKRLEKLTTHFSDNDEQYNLVRDVIRESDNTKHKFPLCPIIEDGEVTRLVIIGYEYNPAYHVEFSNFTEMLSITLSITRALFKSAEKLESTEEETREAELMLSHQLLSPVLQNFEKAQRLVWLNDPENHLENQAHKPPSPLLSGLMVLRGLARKTRSVSWSIGLLGEIARGQDYANKLEKSLVKPRTLIKIAREAAQDHIELIRASKSSKTAVKLQKLRNKKAHVLPDFTGVKIEDPYASGEKRMNVDIGSIEQCVNNLVDNAIKYSRPGRELKIRYHEEYKQVTLEVINYPLIGFEFDNETIENGKKRYWRAIEARLTDADGTGLGLYLVDQILTAQSCKLFIHQTDTEGWNKISIQIPLQ